MWFSETYCDNCPGPDWLLKRAFEVACMGHPPPKNSGPTSSIGASQRWTRGMMASCVAGQVGTRALSHYRQCATYHECAYTLPSATGGRWNAKKEHKRAFLIVARRLIREGEL